VAIERSISKFRETLGNIQSDFAVLVLVGIVVGIGSGLAGSLLQWSLGVFGPMVREIQPERHWWAIFLPAVGAGAAWYFLRRVTHYMGIGMPDVIYAAYRQGGRMSKKSMFTQMVASFLTVGLGGSAGPEGPIAFSGAAIGSNVGTLFRLSEKRRTILLCCGVAGATSAIFNAPVTGMFFAVEVVMGNWASTAIMPIAISSVVANLIATWLVHDGRILFVEGGYQAGGLDHVTCLGLALLVGFVSVIFQRGLLQLRRFFRGLEIPPLAKPMLGGFLVGLIGLVMPDILSTGYDSISAFAHGTHAQGLWLLVALVLAKIITTGLTLGSGGCGGVFSPSLLLGGALGTLYWHLLNLLGPAVAGNIAPVGAYALLGMAAMLGATIRAPVSALFLVAEVTGSSLTGEGAILIPFILTIALSTLVSHYFQPVSFYRQALADVGRAEELLLDNSLMSDIGIDEILVPVAETLQQNRTLASVHEEIVQSDQDRYPVLDEEGHYVGMVRSLHVLSIDPMAAGLMLVADIMDATWPSCRVSQSIPELFAIFEQRSLCVVPIVDADGRLLGLVPADRFLRRYHQELRVQTS